MKVLHVITGLNVGGAENMLAKLIEQGGADIPEVLSLLPPGPIAERIRACGVTVHTLGMRRGVAGPVAMHRLARMVVTIDPDLVHGWMYHGNLAASYARNRLKGRRPLVWNVRHSIPDIARESAQTRLLLKVSTLVSRGPEALVYNAHVSRAQHERLGFASSRGVVIPNGFDTSKFAPNANARDVAQAAFGFAPEVFRIACIARLHPMKDQARLVDAVAIARAKGCDVHLVLVGHGLEEPPADLRKLIEKRIPRHRVTTCGARFDVANWLPGIDLLAVPSAWGEGFPNVIGEALACGVPVVATDVGDSARIVGEEGLVVPPGDTAALAQSIMALAALSPDRRRALGLAGRARIVRDYALAKIGARYTELHSACLGRLHREARTAASAGEIRTDTQ